jgi:hypothetical protein
MEWRPSRELLLRTVLPEKQHGIRRSEMLAQPLEVCIDGNCVNK